tara:strand:+ start:211 stop:513 length:303 start_codon:yes stop_codon:yes gene_type:complete
MENKNKNENFDRPEESEVRELIVLNKSMGNSVGFRWVVGNMAKIGDTRFRISSIRRDLTSYYFNGQQCWDVFVDNNGVEEKYVSYENASLEIKRNIVKNI